MRAFDNEYMKLNRNAHNAWKIFFIKHLIMNQDFNS